MQAAKHIISACQINFANPCMFGKKSSHNIQVDNFKFVRDGQPKECELPDAIQATAVALNLCLANKFLKAQEKLRPW